MEAINGKVYPMWSQFIEKKSQWIGGTLEDFGDSIDRALGQERMSTEITDIKLEANGDDSAWFGVVGKDFECGFDVGHGGVTGGDPGWITFSGYLGHSWRIKTKE